MNKTKNKWLILDANVLIDYFQSDPSVLTLASSHIGELYIALPVLDEVKELDRSRLESFGVEVIEPKLEVLIEAEASKGSLSFQDRVCFLLAKEGVFTCVSNDKQLRRECEKESIPILWGLELMILLVNEGCLDKNVALSVADKIHEANLRYIGKEVIEAFKKKIGIVRKK